APDGTDGVIAPAARWRLARTAGRRVGRPRDPRSQDRSACSLGGWRATAGARTGYRPPRHRGTVSVVGPVRRAGPERGALFFRSVPLPAAPAHAAASAPATRRRCAT